MYTMSCRDIWIPIGRPWPSTELYSHQCIYGEYDWSYIMSLGTVMCLWNIYMRKCTSPSKYTIAPSPEVIKKSKITETASIFFIITLKLSPWILERPCYLKVFSWKIHSVCIIYQYPAWSTLITANLQFSVMLSSHDSVCWIYFQSYFRAKPQAQILFFRSWHVLRHFVTTC